jgi:glutaminyl-tRNA synthetase
VQLYDRLFTVPDPNTVDDFMEVLNPESLETVDAFLEPALADVTGTDAVQFERLGYFCPDSVDHSAVQPVFNRIVTLRDSWAKIEKQALAGT